MNTKNHTISRAKHVFAILLLLLGLAGSPTIWSQTSQGFNFQAVAREDAGTLMTSSDITVIAGIRMGSEEGELVWQETQIVRTNKFGLFDLVLCGDPALKTGGSLTDPADIDWSAAAHFLALSIDAGNGPIEMGVQPLRPVPYSLASIGVSQKFPSLSVGGKASVPDEEALFMVRRSDGYPVFAVYEDGVWAFTDSVVSTKGKKGGFAVGGYKTANKSNHANTYLRVTPDSVRINVDYTPAKGIKGGFAVGGYHKEAKSAAVNFMQLTPENYFIGHNAGISNTTGRYNAFLGYKAGSENMYGSENIFIGYGAGRNHVGVNPDNMPVPGSLDIGNRNTYVGYESGYSSIKSGMNTMIGCHAGYYNLASSNTFVGDASGYNNTTGTKNVFLGTSSGMLNETGANNIFLGVHAGFGNSKGSDNVAIGNGAGSSFKSGINNVFIGSGTGGAGYYGSDGAGSYNVVLGFQAGYELINGSNNIFIGNQAGKNEDGSNLLYIANSETNQPLVWGSFEQKNLVINGNGTDNTAKLTFYVNGDAGGNLAWSTESDARMKKDVEPISQALAKVLSLQGVNFTWKDETRGILGKQMGFIAQQAEPIVPEVVINKEDHYSMQYAPITALLVEAVKEQQKILNGKEKEIQELRNRVEKLEEILLSTR
ncbi:MAG: tail fiber domain-containing protein [Bacteroidales bacterium]|nr:tail fiber domain-containing protein [Bacteroidales bacterium]MDT8432218.1 tail fiber domain-containing protein [Bacteroidales bacterium]